MVRSQLNLYTDTYVIKMSFKKNLSNATPVIQLTEFPAWGGIERGLTIFWCRAVTLAFFPSVLQNNQLHHISGMSSEMKRTLVWFKQIMDEIFLRKSIVREKCRGDLFISPKNVLSAIDSALFTRSSMSKASWI